MLILGFGNEVTLQQLRLHTSIGTYSTSVWLSIKPCNTHFKLTAYSVVFNNAECEYRGLPVLETQLSILA
jgi:hypothetical protein